MKRLLLFAALLVFNFGFSQTNKTQESNNNTRISVLEEKTKSNEEKTTRLNTNFDKLDTETEEKLKTLKQETKETINQYLYFGSAILAVLIFLINFFGKLTIKRRVEEIISETAHNHIERKISETLNSKITSDLIEQTLKQKNEEALEFLIKNLREKGDSAIEQIKEKGAEALSMLQLPPKSEQIIEEGLSDEEIELKIKKSKTEEYFNLAFNTSNPSIQIELYKKVLEIEPNNIGALNNIGVAYNNLDQVDNALNVLNSAIEIDQNFYQAFANRANSYNLIGELNNALKDANKAIEIDPSLEYSYAVKGNILTKLGKLEEAEQSLHRAIEINPNSAEAYLHRGFFYEEQKKYSDSLSDYLKSENLGIANKALLYNNMAVLFRRLKEFDKAIEYIEKARQYNPNLPNIDGTLALIYSDKNDEYNFYKHLEIALQKGCPVWNYLHDYAFDKYRNTNKLRVLIETYKKNYSKK